MSLLTFAGKSSFHVLCPHVNCVFRELTVFLGS